MATADVILPEQAASAFDKAGSFISNVTINTAAATTGSVVGNVPTEIQKSYFALNSQAFIDLQVYLKTAMRLPNTREDFETKYPEKLFKKYTDKDNGLYAAMRNDLVDIHKRCAGFSADTLGPMILLAGKIAMFSDTAAKRGLELETHLKTIYEDNADLSSPKTKASIEEALVIATELSENATATRLKCEDKVKELSEFKTATANVDRPKLTEINRRSDAVLPTTDQLNDELRNAMNTVTETMKKIEEEQAVEHDKLKTLGAVRKLCWIPWMGFWIDLSIAVWSLEIRKRLDAMNTEMEKISNGANDEMAQAVAFRNKCGSLIKAIDAVDQAIDAAIIALDNINGAFSALANGMDDIATKLDQIKGYVVNGNSSRRVIAFRRLREGSERWSQVAYLAQQFQANGLVMEGSLKAEASAEPPPQVEILSATFAGIEATTLSKILFNDSPHLSIPSIRAGFGDIYFWDGVTRTTSILHSYGEEKRILIFTENTGTYQLVTGGIQESRKRNNSGYLSVVNPLPQPSGTKAKILAIVYGRKEVRDPSVWDYAYKKLHSGEKIEWSNANMGGDEWPNMPKSGAIYYTYDGKTVKQNCGRENTQTAWV